ncbi:LPXTG cell wall anchor domain-containing protein [Planomicrobium sp. CPCC 101079]|nr:LPXTG cell wall anchor domain-containing protein [Planomicrobium sp. CPCC 101079]
MESRNIWRIVICIDIGGCLGGFEIRTGTANRMVAYVAAGLLLLAAGNLLMRRRN